MIKNIIFDFGNVLIPITESRSWKALEELGANGELKEQGDVFNQYDTGKISTKQFQQQLQPFFFRKVFPNDIGKAWNAMIDTVLPEESIELIKTLKSKYRVFLLSNTCELHIEAIKRDAGPFNYKQFLRQFEKTYYSYELGLSKPDVKIFEKVLKDNELEADETFYIEDTKKHILAAESLGIKTWHFNPEEDDINDLDKVLSKLH